MSDLSRQLAAVSQAMFHLLIWLIHKVYNSFIGSSDVLVYFLDLTKAFHQVYHDGVLFKLETIDVMGNLFRGLKVI